MTLTEHLDLRSGRICWLEHDPGILSSALPSTLVDVAIIGAGVMGAMLAERLTAAGRSVALVDRRPPGRGSTAASTALVMWAADTPLTALAETHGAKEAARRWRRVHAAVLDLADRVTSLGLECAWASRPEVYLSGDLLDALSLEREGRARRDAGLPSDHLRPDDTSARFDIPPRPALVSQDAFEVDPIQLTLGLLARSLARGASLTYPVDVVSVSPAAHGVNLVLADGCTIAARQAVFATGYEAPRPCLPAAFKLGSSFAIASPPGLAPAWKEKALIWEASDPYLYARATADGRIVIGGGDEDWANPKRRDALLAKKAELLSASARTLLGRDEVITLDCAWAATFGRSPDGLPAIGRVRDFEALWLTSGFGGNGVTFASLTASMISSEITGEPDPDMECFSPYRFG